MNESQKISAVYKIVNEVTGDFYVGSSKNVKERLAQHKRISVWKQQPNNPLYKDMQKYGIENFRFQVLVQVEPEYLTETEQKFIEMLKPTYNSNRANGRDVERYRKSRIQDCRKWYRSHRDEHINNQKSYYKAHKDETLARHKIYYSKLCLYEDETLTLKVLISRFRRRGITNPTQEAKKYLLEEDK